MFEFDAGKLIIIGIVALIVIGPKELPRVMRQVGLAVGKMRKLAGEFQSQFMEAMREADVADIKAEAEKLANQAKIDVGFNPVAQVKAELTKALQGPNEVSPTRLPPETHAAPSEPAASLPAGQGPSVAELPVEAAAHSAPEALSPDHLAPESPAPKPAAALPSEQPAAPEPVPLRTSA
ncbi:MAG: twin-arginine translocase TatA/TatE family subunit [Beijerinckiaceae bacterium]